MIMMIYISQQTRDFSATFYVDYVGLSNFLLTLLKASAAYTYIKNVKLALCLIN
jgi:hypothetical protein